LGDNAEAYFTACTWQLLVNLHKAGWQILRCEGRRGQGYYSIDGDRPKHVCVREQGKKSSKVHQLPRAYLVLLSTAELLRFQHEIPHLGRAEHYNALLDVAFPHHAKLLKKQTRHALQNMDPNADIIASFIALLDTVPDPVGNPAHPPAPPIADDVQSSPAHGSGDELDGEGDSPRESDYESQPSSDSDGEGGGDNDDPGDDLDGGAVGAVSGDGSGDPSLG
jgi:hypothetical protein